MSELAESDSGEPARPALPAPTNQGTGGWVDVLAPPPPEWRLFSRVKLIAGGLIVGLLVTAAFLTSPLDPYAMSETMSAPPQWLAGPHVLGTDLLGRDVLSRLMLGTRLLWARCLALLLIVWFGTLAPRAAISVWQRRRPDTSTPLQAITWVLLAGIAGEVVYGALGLQQLDRLGLVSFLAVGARPVLANVDPSLGSLMVEGERLGLKASWPVLAPATVLLLASLGVWLLGSGLADLRKLDRWRRENLDERGQQWPIGRAWRDG